VWQTDGQKTHWYSAGRPRGRRVQWPQ
jgi:hypothetical protein